MRGPLQSLPRGMFPPEQSGSSTRKPIGSLIPCEKSNSNWDISHIPRNSKHLNIAGTHIVLVTRPPEERVLSVTHMSHKGIQVVQPELKETSPFV